MPDLVWDDAAGAPLTDDVERTFADLGPQAGYSAWAVRTAAFLCGHDLVPVAWRPPTPYRDFQRCRCGYEDDPAAMDAHTVDAGCAELERRRLLPPGSAALAARLVDTWAGTLPELAAAVAGILTYPATAGASIRRPRSAPRRASRKRRPKSSLLRVGPSPGVFPTVPACDANTMPAPGR